MTIEQLNTPFAIDGCVRVGKGDGGLPMIDVTTKWSQARVSIYAGQVLSFQPAGQSDDLMFLSKTAYYASGKAIKGGVPICWPWFGPDPEGKGRPGHGFVRNRPWNVLGSAALADGRVQIRLGLHDDADTRQVWDQSFQLELQITVGETLDMALITRNTGTTAFALTQALHTYLAVGDIARSQVSGLEQTTYIDKMDGGVEKVQHGPVRIDGETDRIYTGVSGALQVEDKALNRRITITPRGSASAVVWNPWAATAAAMGDLGDDDYKVLLCVETTNAGPDVIDVAPGAEHCLGVEYAVTTTL